MNDTDILVIGAGISGAAAAYALAPHARVRVIEGETQAGWHATGRSAALYERHYGNATVRLLSKASHAFLDRPPPGFTEVPLLTRRGGLTVGDRDHRKQLEALLASAEGSGDIAEIGAEEALAMVPVLRPEQVKYACYEPGVMDMDVNAIHQGFLKAMRARGVVLTLEAPVRRIHRDGAAWQVETTAGSWRAPILINAAGAWADEIACIAGVAPIGLEAKRRTVVILPAPATGGHRGWPCVGVVGEEAYFKPEAGRLLVSPGDATVVAPHDVQADELDVARAVDWLQRQTTLAVPRIERRWAGLRSFAPDNSPVVGEDSHAAGFHWLAGQGGYGIMMAEALGRMLAALVLKDAVPRDLAALGLTRSAIAPERFRK